MLEHAAAGHTPQLGTFTRFLSAEDDSSAFGNVEYQLLILTVERVDRHLWVLRRERRPQAQVDEVFVRQLIAFKPINRRSN